MASSYGIPSQGHWHNAAHGASLIIQLVHDDLNIKGIGNVLDVYKRQDFLLGETNIPDRKNYDIAELGLSVEAAKNLYTCLLYTSRTRR